MRYAILVAPLSEEDGGGYAGFVPDLPGCMSDGSTQEEAISNTKMAIEEWISGYEDIGRKAPRPGNAFRQAAAARRELEREVAEAHEARVELEKLVSATVEVNNGLELRLEAMEIKIDDLHDKADHLMEWFRFIDLTGQTPSADAQDREDMALRPS